MPFAKSLFLYIFIFCSGIAAQGQLTITTAPNAQALAQRLVGDGVTISNVTLIADSRSTAFFKNIGGTNIGIDSGIVLTNGQAKSTTLPASPGLDGNGVAFASSVRADLDLSLSGDADLDLLVTPFETNDATVLEFDFVPLGDTIKFRYVFSSEEYPNFACSNFNDVFAFFIQGPGFPVKTNIALIPNTTQPVTINNINGSACSPATPFPQYFVNNSSNTQFNHNGHTVVFTAVARVQPCETYHLKLAIADVDDGQYDSGVFLEAKSLTSNAVQLVNLTQVDPVSGNSYLVEGCAIGSLNIKRRVPGASPLLINLSYGGTAQNTLDIQTLPSSITIPANQDSVLLQINPIMDLVPEGIENLVIYTLAGCAAGLPTDSTAIQIRDYDILGISPDTSIVCGNSSVQLVASAGYTTYQWDPQPSLSSTTIPNPVASPTAGPAMYVCTASVGTCQAKDSAWVAYKTLELLSKTDVNCKNGSTGAIHIGAGPEWLAPLQFSLNGGPFQPDSSFTNLPVGTYTVYITDGASCLDSIAVTLVQAFPDITETHSSTQASCSGNADGTVLVIAAGGNPAYQYSINGTTFGASNTFPVLQGTYTVTIKDANGCLLSTPPITVTLNNDLVIDAGPNDTICEGRSTMLNAVSPATQYSWSPGTTLSSSTVKDPVANPVVNTKYYVTGTFGICTQTDSVIVYVHAAPLPNAGNDATICFGASIVLQGSGGTNFSWTPSTYLSSTSTGQPTVQKPKDDVEYYLDVVDANGCASLTRDTVKIKVTPAVQLFAGKDTIVAMNQPLQLQVVQVGAQTVTSYVWSPNFGLNNPNIHNPVATLDRDIFTFYVTGTTPANCEGTDTITIKTYKGPEIYVPTAFTPNGDGNNDVLRAIAIGMKEYHYFRVFNRWGQEIFYTKDFQAGWDGRIKGVLQNTGTYVWIAEAVDFRGNVIQRKGTTMILH